MEKTRTISSYYHKDLSISINVPINWDVVKNEDFAFAVIDNSNTQFKVNVGFNLYALEGENPSKFQEAIDSVKQNLESEYPSYKSICEEQVWIDGYPAFYHEYEWDSEDLAGILQQSMTLIFVFPNRLYEIIGSLDKNSSDASRTEITKIISSFRYIKLK